LGRYSLAIIKMFKDNDMGQILLKKLKEKRWREV
jgi:hypothetical protein